MDFIAVLANYPIKKHPVLENFKVAQIWLCDPPFDAEFHAEFKNVSLYMFILNIL